MRKPLTITISNNANVPNYIRPTTPEFVEMIDNINRQERTNATRFFQIADIIAAKTEEIRQQWDSLFLWNLRR